MESVGEISNGESEMNGQLAGIGLHPLVFCRSCSDGFWS
jgi:hypothetical protein